MRRRGTDSQDGSDEAAAEIRRLRETIKNIFTAVVVAVIVVVIWISYDNSRRNAGRDANQLIECLRAGGTAAECSGR